MELSKLNLVDQHLTATQTLVFTLQPSGGNMRRRPGCRVCGICSGGTPNLELLTLATGHWQVVKLSLFQEAVALGEFFLFKVSATRVAFCFYL